MSTIADLFIRIGVKDLATAGVEKASSRMGHSLTKVGKAAAFVGGAAAIGGLVAVLGDGIGEWQDSTKVAAQTEAALKSTGGAAGVTADHVSDLAGALLKKSGMDDEAIQSGENLLLTFTNIRNEAGKGNDIFDQTTKTMVDMSVALGQDTKSSAIQLGKALNDPIKGVTALQRVGVSFTAAQKDQIKAMVKAGDTMGAQKLILRELNKEFGGSAEAVGKTLPGQISVLRESFNNLAGQVVGELVPVMAGATKWLNDHWTQISDVLDAVFKGIAWTVMNVVAPAMAAVVKAGQVVVAWFESHWPQIQQTAQNVWTNVKFYLDAFMSGVGLLRDTVAKHWDTIERNFNAAKVVIEDALKAVRDALKLVNDLLHGDWSKAWNDAKALVHDVIDGIKALIVNAVDNMKAAALALGRAVLNGVKDGITGVGGFVLDTLNGIKNTLVGQVSGIRADGVSVGKAAYSGIADGLTGIGGWVAARMGDVGGALSGAVRSIENAASSVGDGIVSGFENGLSGLGSALRRAIVNPLNAVISAWNAIGFDVDLPSVNTHIPGVGRIGGGHLSFHVPQVPTLAIGTNMVNADGLAYLHAGEAVVPADVAGGGFSGGGGITIQGDLVIREEIDIDRAAARIGRKLAVAGL